MCTNNTLYGTYKPATGTATKYVVLNGSSLSLINNLDASNHGFENTFNIVFNNLLCAGYINNSGTHQLAVFNGTKWTVLPNPDNSTTGIRNKPIIYKNKLYVQYYTVKEEYVLMVYDGVNNPTLIANPADKDISDFSAAPIVYHNQLYYGYVDTNGVSFLARFNGSSISLTPNPDNTFLGVQGTPAIYNNKLYYFYLDQGFKSHLAEYQKGTGTLKLIANPASSGGCAGPAVVLNNNLYFEYFNTINSPAMFNGDSIAIIPNPAGKYNGQNDYNGYLGYPIIFDSTLFLQYGSATSTNVTNLCYLTYPTISINNTTVARPVTGMDTAGFTIKLSEASNQTIKISYQTKNGTAIAGKDYVAQSGTIKFNPGVLHKKINISIIGNAKKTDKVFYVFLSKPVNTILNKKDSGICTIQTPQGIASFAKTDASGDLKFAVYPNPANKFVTVTLPANTMADELTVFEITGRKILNKKINYGTPSQTIHVSSLAKGMYKISVFQHGVLLQSLGFIKQ